MHHYTSKHLECHCTRKDTQLGVVGVPRTKGYRRRESQPRVSCTDTIHSNQQMETSMKTLSDRSGSDRQSNERVRDGFPARRGKLEFTRHGAAFTSTQSVSASRKHCV